jgi:superfamily II DNA or RNA helicase
MKRYPKEIGIICQGTEQEHYNALTKNMTYYQGLSEDMNLPFPVRTGCRNKFLNIASKRKNFIAEVKTEAVNRLIKEFRANKLRFICFTGSIKQVEELGSKSAVHSKNDDKLNQELIDCFNKEECSELFAVKMLRESINLTNIERGVITQLDSGIGSFFQMLGRCLRHEFPEMHLFVLQETQDVVYFKRSMSKFNDKYVTWR